MGSTAGRTEEHGVMTIEVPGGGKRLKRTDPVYFVDQGMIQVFRHNAVAEPAQQTGTSLMPEQNAVVRIHRNCPQPRKQPAQIACRATQRAARSDTANKAVDAADLLDQDFSKPRIGGRIVGIIILLRPKASGRLSKTR